MIFFCSISWRAFTVSLVNDPNSQVGKVEILTPIQINTTIPSWNQGVLDVPALTFDYGLHKFVFRFQVWNVLTFIDFFSYFFIVETLKIAENSIEGLGFIFWADFSWARVRFNPKEVKYLSLKF